jgi:hypothetical protein
MSEASKPPIPCSACGGDLHARYIERGRPHDYLCENQGAKNCRQYANAPIHINRLRHELQDPHSPLSKLLKELKS